MGIAWVGRLPVMTAIGLLRAMLAAAACWESVGALSRISDRDGLETFLRHPLPALERLFGRPVLSLAPSHVGQLDGDLLIAARVLILPGLALGAALVLHEALHTLGLQENPPLSTEITQRVLDRCGG